MADYAVTFAKSARRELESLEAAVVARVFGRIEDLARKPRPRECLKLRGRQGLWRLRVGDYRVIYTIDDDQCLVDIVAVRHRRERIGRLAVMVKASEEHSEKVAAV